MFLFGSSHSTIVVMRSTFLTLLIGLAIGAVAGAILGWAVPIEEFRAGFDQFHPDYKSDYAVMVGAAYTVDGDWDRAQARLGRLAEPDPAAYIVRITEQYIAQGRSPDDIRHLARLAARFGYITPAMAPYLPASP